jgi:hypothetical protein
MTVVMAANGYPGDYKKGSVIRGLDEAGKLPGAAVFHAGTSAGSAGEVLATGGRVLNVSAVGKDAAEARARAYAAAGAIDWPVFCRRDTGWSLNWAAPDRVSDVCPRRRERVCGRTARWGRAGQQISIPFNEVTRAPAQDRRTGAAAAAMKRLLGVRPNALLNVPRQPRQLIERSGRLFIRVSPDFRRGDGLGVIAPFQAILAVLTAEWR